MLSIFIESCGRLKKNFKLKFHNMEIVMHKLVKVWGWVFSFVKKKKNYFRGILFRNQY